MRLLTAIAALSLLASPAFAASASGTAQVNVLVPVTVTQTQGIDFGNLIPPTSGSGNVTLYYDGSMSVDGGIANSGSRHNAAFTITGSPSTVVAVAVDPTFIVSDGSGHNITATTNSDLPVGGTKTLSGAGTAAVRVGAGFSLSASSAAGNYSGSFSVTANYQ